MKLNIGSGACGETTFFGKGKGWVNVDFSYTPELPEWQQAEYLKFDLVTTPWPLGEESVDCIFASHIVEHIEYQNLRPMFREIHRVLKRGAPIRIICPDPRVFWRNFQAKNKQHILDCYGPENYERWNYKDYPNIGHSDMFFNDHYDHHLIASMDMIAIVMINVGFVKVTEMQYTNSEFPEFFGNSETSIDNRPVMSYYLEGVKA